ncbi:hypothetical protein C1645_834395 [Glomus cerebriforme]|uniref:Uncharacterized protein n=1 Tax=Glomus cerebriforme TaxID=658196 RepID=A0A397SC34_9GLOM|nr:hypothetical protein C1645_834395 [Glomus cerebriforme]
MSNNRFNCHLHNHEFFVTSPPPSQPDHSQLNSGYPKTISSHRLGWNYVKSFPTLFRADSLMRRIYYSHFTFDFDPFLKPVDRPILSRSSIYLGLQPEVPSPVVDFLPDNRSLDYSDVPLLSPTIRPGSFPLSSPDARVFDDSLPARALLFNYMISFFIEEFCTNRSLSPSTVNSYFDSLSNARDSIPTSVTAYSILTEFLVSCADAGLDSAILILNR